MWHKYRDVPYLTAWHVDPSPRPAPWYHGPRLAAAERVEASAGTPPNRRRLVRVVHGTPEAAIAKLDELRAELDHESDVAAADSFADLCRRYVDDRERLGRAPSYVVEMRRSTPCWRRPPSAPVGPQR